MMQRGHLTISSMRQRIEDRLVFPDAAAADQSLPEDASDILSPAQLPPSLTDAQPA